MNVITLRRSHLPRSVTVPSKIAKEMNMVADVSLMARMEKEIDLMVTFLFPYSSFSRFV